jgi:hypothetical protein
MGPDRLKIPLSTRRLLKEPILVKGSSVSKLVYA